MKAAKNNMVKVLGQTVRVGSKRHQILLEQVKLFNQAAKSENGL
jgi:hypothetical protein